MTSRPQLSCRIHRATGRFTCTYNVTRAAKGGPYSSTEDALERSRRESTRRARRCVDELIHDYDLRLMWTLTYAIEPEHERAMFTTITAFTRRLRAAGLTSPRLIVPEHDPTTRRHLHMAVPTLAPLETMAALWTHGEVRGPDMDRATDEDALRTLSSYLTKSFERAPKGYRRYVASAGLRPVEQRFQARDAVEALAVATTNFGTPPLKAESWAGGLVAFYKPTVTTGTR